MAYIKATITEDIVSSEGGNDKVVKTKSTGKLDSSVYDFGASLGNVAQGNDSRLTDARTPLSHVHSIADVSDLQTALDAKSPTSHNHTGVYAPVLGADDNYVTDAQLVVIGNTSGTNTGDQTLPTDATIVTTDVATNNTSTSKHGWFPKLPTATDKFLRDDMTWQNPPGGSTPTWGSIIGTLGNQTDLQNALDAKATTSTLSASYPTTSTLVATYPTTSTVSGTYQTKPVVLSTITPFSSSTLAGTLTDKTGSGITVFATAPVLTTPSIASFAQAQHNHQDGAGGGIFNASSIFSMTGGQIKTSVLGTGTADNTTFLRGDSTWATPAGGADPFTKLVLASSVRTAVVAPVDLPGMSFAYAANSQYAIDIYARVNPLAAGNGYGFGIRTTTAVPQIAITTVNQLANTGTLAGGNAILSASIVGVSSGFPTAAVYNPVYGGGMLLTGSVAGTAQFIFRAETAAASVVCGEGTMIRTHKFN